MKTHVFIDILQSLSALAGRPFYFRKLWSHLAYICV